MSKTSKSDLFLELANPDEHGFSRPVSVSKFTGKYQELHLGNGGSWCRDDGPLGRTYNIHRIKEKGKIVAVELHGYNRTPILKPIPRKIREVILNQRCVVLGTSKVEVDHKDGRRDDPRLSDATKVTLDDFQPLSKAANNAKRQACKDCRNTGKRYDATLLSYPFGQALGNGEFRGTCVGCFWHDPVFFRRQIIKMHFEEMKKYLENQRKTKQKK